MRRMQDHRLMRKTAIGACPCSYSRTNSAPITPEPHILISPLSSPPRKPLSATGVPRYTSSSMESPSNLKKATHAQKNNLLATTKTIGSRSSLGATGILTSQPEWSQLQRVSAKTVRGRATHGTFSSPPPNTQPIQVVHANPLASSSTSTIIPRYLPFPHPPKTPRTTPVLDLSFERRERHNNLKYTPPHVSMAGAKRPFHSFAISICFRPLINRPASLFHTTQRRSSCTSFLRRYARACSPTTTTSQTMTTPFQSSSSLLRMPPQHGSSPKLTQIVRILLSGSVTPAKDSRNSVT